jgi:hypothetical protein
VRRRLPRDVDLGPSLPVNEPAGIGSVSAYANRVTVALQPLGG